MESHPREEESDQPEPVLCRVKNNWVNVHQ